MSSSKYDLVAIGGGAAGLTAAGIGASLGARTLLVEKDRLGGDCTWTGCVPSKTLLKSAHVADQARTGGRFGLNGQVPSLSFEQVMKRVHETRQAIYDEADAPEHLESFGIEVQMGTARFINAHAVVLDSDDGPRRIDARRFVIATGARPTAPPMEGLENTGYLTNHTLFELTEQPGRLAIIGGGPVGTEMAQAFQRLGTEVTVIERSDRILRNDHPALAARLRRRLEGEGVRYLMVADVRHVEREGDTTLLHVDTDGDKGHETVRCDALLVATGRRPNVEELGLEVAGIEYDHRGITVDDRCRTSQRHIFAAGDVTGRYQFMHMSEHMAKVAATNALLKLPQKIDEDRVPWVTYTDPELAHVGATQAELDEEGTGYGTYRFPMDRLDRAICEGETTGEIRVYATKWRGKILGADVLAARGGELIGTVALAMKTGATLRQIADTIFPYPTYGQGVRRAADQWYAQKQQPWIVRGIQTLFGYDGRVIKPDPDRIV